MDKSGESDEERSHARWKKKKKIFLNLVRERSIELANMGNVQHKGKSDGLTKFQRKKLKYEFNTFFGE